MLITDGTTMAAARWLQHQHEAQDPTAGFWTSYGISGFEWDFEVDMTALTHWHPLPELPR